MVKFNCIIREDNVGRIVSEDAMLDAVDIEETLRSHYIYLYNAIKEDNYKLKVNHCTYFKEIVFKKKVVGFSAYTMINSVSNLTLVASYILPEFRKKGLFFDEINNIFEDDKELSIYLPPSFVMDLLVKYGFAKKINENIIISSININIPSNSISNIFGTDKTSIEKTFFTSNIYDSKLCGFLVFPEDDKNVLYLTDCYPEDDEKHCCIKERENISDNYQKDVENILKQNNDEIQDFLKNIHNNFSYHNTAKDEVKEDIDFEELKKIKINENTNETLLKNLEKLETNKHSLLINIDDIDKMEYVETYKNVGVYDFIRIFNDNKNIELTNSIIKIDYEFNSDYIKNLVIKENYIGNEINTHEKESYLIKLKVNQLKDILKDNNLTVTGNKSELISRIMEYVPSSYFPKTKYHVTKKGFEFMEEHEEIDFYNLFLKNFYYHEFKNFLLENEGDITEVTLQFLLKHLEISVIKRDNKAYMDTLQALAYLHSINNSVKCEIYYELKLFIVGLNPIFRDETLYNYYQPINKSNIENIKYLLAKNTFNLESEFNRAWKSMEIKKFIIPRKKSMNILCQMISGEDRDYMNDKIREEYITQDKIIHDKLDKSKQSTLDKYFMN